MRIFSGLILAALGWTATLPVSALDLKPRLEAEGRWFYNTQPDGGEVSASAAGTLEFFHEFSERSHRVAGEFFGRWDEQDPQRSHADVRELYYHYIGDSHEVRLGSRRVYWGVTESRHLVDIINQSDFVEDIDGEAKLGQPMANLALIRDFGTIDLFYLPYQPERTFVGPEGRPRLPFPVAEKEARYESRRGQQHPGGALRFTTYVGPVDIGIGYFNGTAREPRLVPCLRQGSGYPDTETQANCDVFGAATPPPSAAPEALIPVLQAAGLAPSDEAAAAAIAADVIANLVLVPHYDLLEQVSLDLQYVIEALALKVEALVREERGEQTAAAVAGFEYTFGDVASSGADIGVLAEYLYDERDDALDRADDEVFAGMRVALNDIPGTTLLAGGLAERKGLRNRFWLVEASRRLGNDWKLSVEAKVFALVAPDRGTAFLADQDFVTVVLERYF